MKFIPILIMSAEFSSKLGDFWRLFGFVSLQGVEDMLAWLSAFIPPSSSHHSSFHTSVYFSLLELHEGRSSGDTFPVVPALV